MATDPDRNKSNALAFYDLMFNQCKPREALESYVGEEYIQQDRRMLESSWMVGCSRQMQSEMVDEASAKLNRLATASANCRFRR